MKTERNKYDASRCFSMGILLMMFFFTTACSNNDNSSDAYGNFEAGEVVVSAENNGTLIDFPVQEGDILKAGRQVGLIDTTMDVLNLKQLESSLESVSARRVQLQKSIAVQMENLKVLKKEVDRVSRLRKEKAIPTQKYDEVTGQYDVALKRLEQIRSQKLSLLAEKSVINSKMDAAKERISRCHVVAPVDGTVLQKYAEKGEFTAIGKPLFKIAETRELILRAYVSGAQLDDIRIGQRVTVKFDESETSDHQANGKIVWIASSAEFTPKIIQTKEERVDLVYAIKVRVPNEDGRLKIGMPGEVVF
ncbi:HlyD family secretion protein [Marinilabilia rubra]|uniref:HlyD family secretion protein n=1 Tax=Marinilabilia rubra TaxID=2162893 RepID=A0A2U2B3D8_9BACT|nr:HlyD family efflux transporter periplasmic adaptor subunit [Marinilabilia rubra]PWD97570.1 HlyD family secretion protein [Marinilabilia rubra]